MIKVPERITGAWLNSLSQEEHAEVLRGPFGRRMHAWVASHVTFIHWTVPTPFGSKTRNGSIFFLDIGGKLLAVTAAHVFREYLAAKQKSARISCRVENLEFEPERRVVGQGSNIDIATFNFSYDELRAIRKQGPVADSASWPPPHPFSGQGALFAGFPRASRLWIDRRSISLGLYSAFLRIDSSYDLQITCPFERDCWIDATERGLPPRGFDLGGISGGPLITPMDTDGVWNLHLAGVVSEAKTSKDYETVVSVPAHFIACDGTIYDERSAPIRHAVAA